MTRPAPATRPPVTLAPRRRAAVSVTSVELTPAMLELLKRQERQDPLGDAVRWAASRAPAVEALLDKYCPNGKVGPLPLGVAAAGVVVRGDDIREILQRQRSRPRARREREALRRRERHLEHPQERVERGHGGDEQRGVHRRLLRELHVALASRLRDSKVCALKMAKMRTA